MAIDSTNPVARKGIDKIIKSSRLSLTFGFDAGRLKDIQFDEGYQFIEPLSPYIDTWKNFEKIGDLRIKPKMQCEGFIDYIEAWEQQAIQLGAEKIRSGDLKENQFSFSFQRNDTFFNFHMSVGPSRRAGGGGLWASGWHASFARESDAKRGEFLAGEMMRLSAFCDDFNTVARRKLEFEPPRFSP